MVNGSVKRPISLTSGGDGPLSAVAGKIESALVMLLLGLKFMNEKVADKVLYEGHQRFSTSSSRNRAQLDSNA